MRYLLISLLIHGLIFVFSGRTFLQHAQYSVEASVPTYVQTVEVSIEEIKYAGDIVHKGDESIKAKEVIHSKSGVMVKVNPVYSQNPPPEYPELARQMRQQGLVILSVDVGSDGMPIKVEIAQSSNYRMLDEAALKAVRHWKFQPGRMGALSVESKVTIPVRFQINMIK